jgi:hypothetical protein
LEKKLGITPKSHYSTCSSEIRITIEEKEINYEAAFDAKDLLWSTQCTQKLYPVRTSPSRAGVPARTGRIGAVITRDVVVTRDDVMKCNRRRGQAVNPRVQITHGMSHFLVDEGD